MNFNAYCTKIILSLILFSCSCYAMQPKRCPTSSLHSVFLPSKLLLLLLGGGGEGGLVITRSTSKTWIYCCYLFHFNISNFSIPFPINAELFVKYIFIFNLFTALSSSVSVLEMNSIAVQSKRSQSFFLTSNVPSSTSKVYRPQDLN